MLVKPEQKPDSEPLPIVRLSSQNIAKPNVQATPAVGLLSSQVFPKNKASFLLFIKNNKKCKTMKFRPKH